MTTTVVKTIGAGGDYTTLQSWEDAAPSNLTTTRTGTTQAGSTSSTIVLDAGASATNDFYKSLVVSCDARPTEKRLITAYNGTTKIATVGALNGSNATWDNTPGTEAFTVDPVIWQGQIKSATDYFLGSATQLTIAGGTADATHYKQLTTALGASFRDNVNVRTNALTYNPSNGCAIESTGASNNAISVDDGWVHLSNLQVKANGHGMDAFDLSPNHNFYADSCIVETTGATKAALESGDRTAAFVTNCLFIYSGNSLSDYGAAAWVSVDDTYINCTLVAPSGLVGGSGFKELGYYSRSLTVKNCAVFGFTNVFDGSAGATGISITATTCVSDSASPPAGFTKVVYANQFKDNANARRDFRLKANSDCINAGTTDATNAPKDITGVNRPQGGPYYDIGAWEFIADPSFKTKQYEVDGVYVNESGALQYQDAGGTYVNEVVDTSIKPQKQVAGGPYVYQTDYLQSQAAGGPFIVTVVNTRIPYLIMAPRWWGWGDR